VRPLDTNYAQIKFCVNLKKVICSHSCSKKVGVNSAKEANYITTNTVLYNQLNVRKLTSFDGGIYYEEY